MTSDPPLPTQTSAASPPDETRPPRRAPGDYRPDLRPMLILLGLLMAVTIGWIVLSPLLLPPPAA